MERKPEMDPEIFLLERKKLQQRLAEKRFYTRQEWEGFRSKALGFIPASWIGTALKQLVQSTLQRWFWGVVIALPLSILLKKLGLQKQNKTG